MDVKELFLERHGNLHTGNIKRLLEPLNHDQIRLRPHKAVNSVAWLIWHMARCEDVGLSLFVAGELQTLNDDWLGRLGVSQRDIGTGMGDDEVSDFSQKVDIDSLVAYHAAVGKRTQKVVAGLTPEDLDELADPSEVHRLLEEQELLGESASWVEDLWAGKRKAGSSPSWASRTTMGICTRRTRFAVSWAYTEGETRGT